MEMNIERREKPKNRWLNEIEIDIKTASVCINDTERR